MEAATTESRVVRVSDTSHLTRPTEIENSLWLAKPAADRAVPCRKSEILQQQNGGGVVSTQVGHTPVRLVAQDQTADQCRQNEISQQQKNSSEGFNDWGGRGYDDFVPGEVTKIALSSGRQACPEFIAFDQRVGQICLR